MAKFEKSKAMEYTSWGFVNYDKLFESLDQVTIKKINYEGIKNLSNNVDTYVPRTPTNSSKLFSHPPPQLVTAYGGNKKKNNKIRG